MKKNKTIIGNMKVSQAIPFLKIAATHYDFNLSFQTHWTAACRFIINSIKNN